MDLNNTLTRDLFSLLKDLKKYLLISLFHEKCTKSFLSRLYFGLLFLWLFFGRSFSFCNSLLNLKIVRLQFSNILVVVTLLGESINQLFVVNLAFQYCDCLFSNLFFTYHRVVNLQHFLPQLLRQAFLDFLDFLLKEIEDLFSIFDI